MSQPTRGLGRGLESLIPVRLKPELVAQPGAPAPVAPTSSVPIDKIRPNPQQPRKHFKEEALKELSDSIREQGLIQPLIVAPLDGDAGGAAYELIAGERRWRAAKMAGLVEVPIVVKRVSERDKFQIALIENIQREDLNPIEEAIAYKKLMEEFTLTQEDLSKALGKGRVVIANTLRLLNLPQSLQDSVANGVISAGHARNLVSIDDELMQREVAQRILDEKLTVRDVEKIVADWKGALESGTVKRAGKKDPEVRAQEEALQQALGSRVEISARGKGSSIKGFVKISYYSLEDLERLIAILNKK